MVVEGAVLSSECCLGERRHKVDYQLDVREFVGLAWLQEAVGRCVSSSCLEALCRVGVGNCVCLLSQVSAHYCKWGRALLFQH